MHEIFNSSFGQVTRRPTRHLRLFKQFRPCTVILDLDLTCDKFDYQLLLLRFLAQLCPSWIIERLASFHAKETGDHEQY